MTKHKHTRNSSRAVRLNTPSQVRTKLRSLCTSIQMHISFAHCQSRLIAARRIPIQ